MTQNRFEKYLRTHGELGLFGNIWIRSNYYPNAGDEMQGHFHKFDHVTFLVNGSVEVTVEGEGKGARIFEAPTFIKLAKDKKHKFKTLEPDTVWYCIYAVRDIDGEVVTDWEIIDREKHDPDWYTGIDHEAEQRLAELEKKTTHTD